MPEIPLYIIAIQDDGFHVFLEAKINGHKTFMLLDTGASRTVLDLKTVQKIDGKIELLENEDHATGLGTDRVKNYVGFIKKLDIGEIQLYDYETGVIDLSHVNESYARLKIQPIGGVLGSDLLMQFDAVINYKKKTMKLSKG